MRGYTMTADWLLLPVMPHWAWPLSWAVVSAAIVLWLWPREGYGHRMNTSQGQIASNPTRTDSKIKGPFWMCGVCAAGVALLALWPNGGWSGYAALALQSPSLLSLTWAQMMFQAVVRGTPASDNSRVPMFAWYLLCALGWLLMIDTLNLWPLTWEVNLYAWGFSAGSLWLCVALVLILAWLRHGLWIWHSIAVLALYALLRWPSGNVWDAWLDPGVWIVAHVQVLRHVWRCAQRGKRP
jgi:hypothetical protein